MKAVFNKRSGFMIVEILISLALAGLLIVTVVSVLAASRRLQNEGKLRQQALDYAREAVELISDIQHDEFIKPGTTACTPMPGYTTCWTDVGWGLNSAPLKLVGAGASWQLSAIVSGDEGFPNCIKISSAPAIYRSIKIDNIGSARPNDVKRVTVDAWWGSCSSNKKITLSTILTAWKN